ncbi:MULTISPECIES: hypothetical protein [Streptomyces]|uniref:Uncharacterized protein n=2 Tax=Streptomyces TaxID=1883 RepID=A0ABW7T7B2_9ACTN
MSDFTNENSERSRRRKRPALWGVAGVAAIAAVATGLLMWKPWVDKAPFTASVSFATRTSTDSTGEDAGTCVPNSSGEPIVIYDQTGKRKLAEGVTSSKGQRLSSEFGDFAGYCFTSDRVEGIPSGQDGYMVQIGGGTMSPMSERDLRASVDQQLAKLKTVKLPDVKEPDISQ